MSGDLYGGGEKSLNSFSFIGLLQSNPHQTLIFRPSFQPWAYLVILAAAWERIACLYETFATYLSRGLFSLV
jgi:hypothetical protein